MLTYQPILTTSIPAVADIPEKRFVGFDGNICAANTKALGASDAGGAVAGQQCSVVSLGITLVEAGAAVSQGASVTSDASGKAIDAAANPVNGRALDAAAADGDIIRILVVP
jgi:hypothetical protein